jgi:hypothetical protein
MSLFKEIFDGWGNLIKDKFGALDQKTKELAQTRLANCHFCKMRKGRICSTSIIGKHIVTDQIVTGCGCSIDAKALSPTSICPLGKW